MLKKTVIVGAALFIMVGMIGFGSSAQAQDTEGINNDSNTTDQVSNKPDRISSDDQTFYKNSHLDTKFGIHLHAHAKVCDQNTQGDAHCDARVTTDTQGKPLATASTPTGYGPKQLLKGYNLSGTTATKKIIAIVDAYDDPNIVNDLNTYSTTFGIPKLPTCSGAIANAAAPCFQKVNQRGSTTQHPLTSSGWALEIALDVEAAHAVCQNCSILLVEADSASYTNLMTAVDKAVALGANVVSNSYGSNEFAGENLYDGHFNHPGVAFTFSAGDSGYGVEYPAASPYVTAVGGTSLFLNADNSYNSEAVWGGTGSGCSTYESKPGFQTDTLCAKRTVADVSAVADPNTGAAVYDSVSYGGRRGWFQVGGTSLAAPVIAATYALSGNIPSGTQENSLPYASAINLHDVVAGTNGSCGTYLCSAAAGFDGPTGLGTPNGSLAF